MSSIVVYHPVGLGDHLACSGIVRTYATTHDRVGVFCLEQNYPSVSALYRDLPNVTVLRVRSHRDIQRFRLRNAMHLTRNHYDRVLNVRVLDEESGIQYEKQLYRSANVPIENLWDKFLLQRDAAAERALMEKLHAPGAYQFIHEDARFPLTPTKLSNLPALRPDLALTKNIFDYCSVIECAQEINVMDSSFMFLVDCLDYTAPNQKRFIHRYARPNMPWNLPLLRKQWTILT